MKGVWGFTLGVALSMFVFLFASTSCERAPDYANRVGRDGWLSRGTATIWTDKRPLQCRLF